MKTLSVTGFRKVCQEISPASFIFDTENQVGYLDTDVKIVSKYSDVIFMLNPNRICFKNENGTVCFNRVKYVRYYDDKRDMGNIFSIVCGNAKDENADVSYTIIADEKIF